MVLLLMEHFYMRYLQTHVQKTTDNGCCALISQVSKGQLISDHEKYFLFRVLKSLIDKVCRYQKFENTKNNYQNLNGQKESVVLSLVSKERSIDVRAYFLPFNYPTKLNYIFMLYYMCKKRTTTDVVHLIVN